MKMTIKKIMGLSAIALVLFAGCDKQRPYKVEKNYVIEGERYDVVLKQWNDEQDRIYIGKSLDENCSSLDTVLVEYIYFKEEKSREDRQAKSPEQIMIKSRSSEYERNVLGNRLLLKNILDHLATDMYR